MIKNIDQLKEAYIRAIKDKVTKMFFECEECHKEFSLSLRTIKNNFKMKKSKILCRACSIRATKSRVSDLEQTAINEKRKATCLAKYGVETFLSTEKARKGYKKIDQKEKTAKALRTKSTRKYEHSGGLQREEVRKRARQSLIKNHGVSSYFEIINKEKRSKRYDDIVKELAGFSSPFLKKEAFIETPTEGKKIHLICNKCKSEYLNTLTRELKRCPLCYPEDWASAKISKGERSVMKFLEKENLPVIFQKTFEGLIGASHPLRFDFYLPTLNICIEYQGRQHYFPYNNSEKEKKAFNLRKEYDSKKRRYCKEKGMRLIEIKYSDDIGTILYEELHSQ